MSEIDERELRGLRWDWGQAYVINGAYGLWAATRRDTGSTFTADSADELRDKIRTDYVAKPVPRPPARRAVPDHVVTKLSRKYLS